MKPDGRILTAWFLVVMFAAAGGRCEENQPIFLRKQQKETYEAVAGPVQRAPKLDGVLDDDCWKDAPSLGAFRVVGRDHFAEKQTVVWARFGTEALYLAAACEDDEVMATSGPRDSDVAWTMDAIELFLCPRRDNEVWFHFAFNPVGARYDDIEGIKRNTAWTPETDWEVAVRKQPWGWTAEVKIPYATMSLATPPGRGDVWKLKCIRTDLSKKEKIQSSWTRVAEAFDTDLLSVGDLIFDSRNLLANPLAAPVGGDDLPDWKVTGGKGSIRRIIAEGEPAALFHWEPESAKVYWANFSFGGRGGYQAAPYDGVFLFSVRARLRDTIKKESSACFRWQVSGDKEPLETLTVGVEPSANFREYRLQHAVKRGQFVGPPELHVAHTGDIEIRDVVLKLDDRMTKKAGAFSLGSNAKIVIPTASDARVRLTAETLQEALLARTGLKLAMDGRGAGGTIQLRAQSSATEKPEGYLLEVGRDGIVITGTDPVGAFYGTQSLVQLVKPDGKGGWEVPFLKIRDWPATPIRYVSGALPISRGLTRALARFKLNYYEVTRAPTREDLAFAEKYCVKLAPLVGFNTAWEANPEEFTERTAGESLSEIGLARRNPCPSHPGVWESYFKQLDAMMDATNADILNVRTDEMYVASSGARWNVCPRCRARNLSGHELWVETLKKIQEHLRQRGRKLLMSDSILGYKGISHPDDAANDWSRIPDLLPPDVKKQMVAFLWHDAYHDALVRNGIAILLWGNTPAFVEKRGFPGHYSGFFLDQSDGATDIAQIVATAQLCWSPQQSKGGGADLPAATSAAQAGADRFLELAVAAIPTWDECAANKVPPSRQADRRNFSVDLGKVANRSRQDDAPCDGKGWVDLGGECDLRSLQPGRRTLAGVPFTLLDEEKNRGLSVVMVENRGALDRQLPARVEIPVGRKAASLSFLHALSRRAGWNYMKKEELCGYYFIVYEDGTYDPFEIKYATNAANWDGKNTRWNYSPTGLALARANLAWRGPTRSGQTAVLYATEWINPKPHSPIRTILFASPQLKTGVCPLLLAVTGFEPVAGDAEDLTVDKKKRLRPVSLLAEPALPGKPIDLSDGVIESKRLYVTRDGLRVSTPSPFLESDTWGEDYEGDVAHVVWDNNCGIECAHANAEVVVELPVERSLCGVVVIGMYRRECYSNDFPPALIDYTVEVSADGKTWEKVADRTGHIPEEEGLRVHSFAPRRFKAVRVTARNNPWDGRNGQLAFIQLYEAQ
ncbi:MAG: hypothetical protein HY360_27350 [Verrucomicrobia bacterium]|nr:hypothetical protein [Verrucomicrobiota bacterium]